MPQKIPPRQTYDRLLSLQVGPSRERTVERLRRRKPSGPGTVLVSALCRSTSLTCSPTGGHGCPPQCRSCAGICFQHMPGIGDQSTRDKSPNTWVNSFASSNIRCRFSHTPDMFAGYALSTIAGRCSSVHLEHLPDGHGLPETLSLWELGSGLCQPCQCSPFDAVRSFRSSSTAAAESSLMTPAGTLGMLFTSRQIPATMLLTMHNTRCRQHRCTAAKARPAFRSAALGRSGAVFPTTASPMIGVV